MKSKPCRLAPMLRMLLKPALQVRGNGKAPPAGPGPSLVSTDCKIFYVFDIVFPVEDNG